mmetsp:Transcript_42529/g.112213  ORF Transcript_42529/g.112213 Transcript_42529/m.112213 type:complete len:202 (-) Transcript_42529:48-653(-)
MPPLLWHGSRHETAGDSTPCLRWSPGKAPSPVQVVLGPGQSWQQTTVVAQVALQTRELLLMLATSTTECAPLTDLRYARQGRPCSVLFGLEPQPSHHFSQARLLSSTVVRIASDPRLWRTLYFEENLVPSPPFGLLALGKSPHVHECPSTQLNPRVHLLKAPTSRTGGGGVCTRAQEVSEEVLSVSFCGPCVCQGQRRSCL